MTDSSLKAFITESLLEYPEHVTAVVFTGACDLTCPWCHNKSLKTLKGKNWKNVLKKLKGSVIDAITFSGGEPLIAPEIQYWIADARFAGFLIQIETNGMHPDILKLIIKKIDRVAIDFKLPLARYGEINGEGERLMESIGLARSAGIDYEIRTTLPEEGGLLSPEELGIIERELNYDPNWVIQYYLKEPVENWLKGLSKPWHTYKVRH